jgi:hypothetical protein
MVPEKGIRGKEGKPWRKVSTWSTSWKATVVSHPVSIKKKPDGLGPCIKVLKLLSCIVLDFTPAEMV